MDEEVRNRKLIVLVEAVNDLPEGLMAIVDEVDEVDKLVEFEIGHYFKSVPLSNVRVATTKERYYYDFWVKHGRQPQLMNVNSIVD